MRNLTVGQPSLGMIWSAVGRIFDVRRRAILYTYGVACALPLLALIAEQWLEPRTGHTSYQLFLGAVALSAVYGGVEAGILSLAISGFLKFHFFLAPQATDSGAALLRLSLFAVLGLLVAWLAGSLRETQRRLDTTLRFIGDAVVVTNSRKRIIFMNAVAEILTGWTRKNAKGKKFHEVVALREDTRGVDGIDAVQRAFLVGSAISIDVPAVLVSSQGGDSAVEGSVAPIRNGSGKMTGAVAVLRDVAEQRAMEVELETARRIQALGRLTAPLAHDFNNLLTVVGGHAELLRGKLATSDDPALVQSAEAIVKAADEAGRLARQFALFGGGPSAPRGRVDINGVLRRMERVIQAITGNHITVITSLQEDIWPIKAAREAVEQIVVNLVTNASEAMPSGGVVQIRTRNIGAEGDEPSQASVLLEVHDDGCGMNDDTRSRIFEPFFTTKVKHASAGLGLPLVMNAVVQHGGRIRVKSEPGGGSTFQVYLPRFEKERNVSAAEEMQQVSRVHVSLAPLVLVVENDDAVRKLISSTLQAHKYSVLEADDGRQALELASQYLNQLDVIVTELTASGITGPELATRIAMLRPDIKVVYISSYPKPAAWGGNGAGPNRAFLFKPILPGEILTQIDHLLAAGSSKE